MRESRRKEQKEERAAVGLDVLRNIRRYAKFLPLATDGSRPMRANSTVPNLLVGGEGGASDSLLASHFGRGVTVR